MATLGFGSSGSQSYNSWGSGIASLDQQRQEEEKKKKQQRYPYGNDVIIPEDTPTTPGVSPTTPSSAYRVTPAPKATAAPGGLSTVDRTKMPTYPTTWNPATQAGQKWDGAKWVAVQSGADVTWDSQANNGKGQSYYRGMPISEAEVQAMITGGPGALGGQQGAPGYMSSSDIQSNLATLGFGTARAPIEVPTLSGNYASATAGQVGAPPAIQAPQITAEQGGFQDFGKLENSMYNSLYNPVKRELSRQQGLADERLAAQLAQAGIAESGAGVAQRAQQAGEYDRQQIAAAEDAASKAATQRYGMEYTQSMENARLRQEANFANAGFTLQAQSENARNFLTASVANAQMSTQASIANAQVGSQRDIAQANLYLQAMGLNFEQQDAAQKNYLSLLNLQQQDLARMDAYQLESLSLFYNTYLKQVAIMVQAGQTSYGKTDSDSGGVNFSLGF